MRLKEFAPPGDDGSGDDGFDDETLKRMAAQWWQGDEDPRIEQTLAAAGWEIGRDEGYDNGGAFVVMAGDENGNSYMSWPAEELESLNEFAPAGGGGNRMGGGGRRTGGDGDDDNGEDPYKYPQPEHYSRSIDFFGRFEADHFDDEVFDDATGEFRGYWNDQEGRDQIAYFKFDNPQRTGDDDPGMGWYYEPQNEAMDEGQNEKIGDRYDPEEWDAMVARVKKLAGLGPLKTVYDPQKRVYKNVPVAVQPAQQPKKER